MSIESALKAQVRANGKELQEKEKADDLAKKNHNFIQVNKSVWKEIGILNRENPSAFAVLWYLGGLVNKQNAVVVSMQTLTKAVRKSRVTTSQAVSYLQKNRWLQIIKIGNSNAYVINSSVFWQNTGDMKTAVFSAAVIADFDEQDKDFEKSVKLKTFPVMQERERIVITSEKLDPPDQIEINLD